MPTFPTRAAVVPLGLVAISGVIAGCGGSSSGGGNVAPSSSTSASASTTPSPQAGGNFSLLREPMSRARAKASWTKLESMPGVFGLKYANGTHELLVFLSGSITVQQRQRVIDAIAHAAND